MWLLYFGRRLRLVCTVQSILFMEIRLIYHYIVKQAIYIVATVENPLRESMP